MLTFPNITPEVFARVLDELRRTGNAITQKESIFPALAYHVVGHHWILGQIITDVTFNDSVVTVDIQKPSSHHDQIGGKIQDAITIAQRELGQGGVA